MSKKYPSEKFVYKKAAEIAPFGTSPSKRVEKAASMLENIADIADEDITTKLEEDNLEMVVKGVNESENYPLWNMMHVVVDAYRLGSIEKENKETYRVFADSNENV